MDCIYQRMARLRMNIFVSYTTRDSYIDRVFLECAADVISGYGISYIDLLHNDSEDKQKHVEHMLSESDVVLLFASRSIGKSEWVQWELQEASRRGLPVIFVYTTSNQCQFLDDLRLKLASEFAGHPHYSRKSAIECHMGDRSLHRN